MFTITPAYAVERVRKNLDEQGLNESLMYADENTDNASLDSLVSKSLPEAINAVHRAAPAYLLEGKDTEPLSCTIEDNVLEFSVEGKILRLAAFQAADSEIVVTDPIPEDSPEGRKQLNPYIRGTYDNPRLVKMQGADSPALFKYYSLRGGSFAGGARRAIHKLKIIESLSYEEEAREYPVSADLVDSAIDQLTADVIILLGGDTEKAKYFSNRAITWKS